MAQLIPSSCTEALTERRYQRHHDPVLEAVSKIGKFHPVLTVEKIPQQDRRGHPRSPQPLTDEELLLEPTQRSAPNWQSSQTPLRTSSYGN